MEILFFSSSYLRIPRVPLISRQGPRLWDHDHCNHHNHHDQQDQDYGSMGQLPRSTTLCFLIVDVLEICNMIFGLRYNSWFETPRLSRLRAPQDSDTPKTQTSTLRNSICIFDLHFCFHFIVTRTSFGR